MSSPGRPSVWLWAALAVSGALLGYGSQANWGAAHQEAIGAGRIAVGIISGALFYPGLAWAWSRLWGWILGRPWQQVLVQTGTLLALLGALLLYPAEELRQPGGLGLALALTLACSVAVLWLGRDLSAPVLLIMALLALGSVGFHDSHSRYFERGSIQKVLKGDADAPWRYRVLVPWSAYGLARAFKIPPESAAFMLRSVMTFVIFLVSIKFLANFMTAALARAAPFLHAALLPFSYLFWLPTDEGEVLGVWLLLWATWSQRHFWALATMLVFALNRETLLILGPWYLAYSLWRVGWGLRNPAWYFAALMVLGVVGEQLLMVITLGYGFVPGDRILWPDNIRVLSDWLAFLGPGRLFAGKVAVMAAPLSFCAAFWLVVVTWWRRLPGVLRLGVIINIPLLFGIQILTARLAEARQLFLLVPFVIAGVLCLLDQAQDRLPADTAEKSAT